MQSVSVDPLPYSEVETMLGLVHRVQPQHLGALRARLKHLKRLGFPEGVNTGRGKSFEYDGKAIFSMLLVFELIQLGLTPERATTLVSHYDSLKRGAWFAIGMLEFYLPVIDQLRAKAKLSNAERSDHLLFLYTTSALSSLMEPWTGNDYGESFSFVSSPLAHTGLADVNQARYLMIDTTVMLAEAQAAVTFLGYPTEYLSASIREWTGSRDDNPQT